MKQWPHRVHTHSIQEILEYAKDESWQKHREDMKGRPTEEKLDMLLKWRHIHQVQIDNYINALKRAGQLDMELKVVR